MGLLRFILAAAVVCVHAGMAPGWFCMSGEAAVRGFFVISGFYMTLILDSKYGDKSRWLFYSNRALRIFPMYYAVLLLCLVMYGGATLATGHPVDRLVYWVQAAHLGEWPQLALIALAHITIIGIETTSYFAFDPQRGFEVNQGLPDTLDAWRFCFLPQTWTVAIELLFYLVAPWLVLLRKRVMVILIVLNVLALFLVNYFLGYLPRVVSSHFFPFTWVFFLAGILSYRLFYHRPQSGPGSPAVNWAILGMIALACVGLGTLHDNVFTDECSLAGFVVLLFFGVPFLFQQTKNLVVDRLIGELSYPMYLVHLPAKWMVMAVHGHAGREANHVSVFVLLPLTVALSAVIVRFIDYPVDRFRQRRAAGAKSEAFPHGNVAPVAGRRN